MLKLSKLWISAIFFLTIAGAALQAVAQSDTSGESGKAASPIPAARERYAPQSWPSSAARQGVPLEALRFSGYQRENVGFTPGSASFSASPLVVGHFVDEKGRPAFFLEIRVLANAAEAREALLEYVAYCSSPGPLPTTARYGVEAGDMGFVGRAPQERVAWIAFIRGNIAVRLCCPDPRVNPHPDLVYLAETLDRKILTVPVLAPEASVSAPEVKEFRLERGSLKAGDSASIDLTVRDPARRDAAAISWTVAGSGQGYVEKDSAGKWRLYTTREGTIDLQCHVLGTLCTAVRARVEVEVLPE